MPRLPRSPELMNRGDTALLVVDVQGKLVQLIPGHEYLVWNIGRLIDGAKILGLPVLATEQYPKGLGPTSPELVAKLGIIPAKLAANGGPLLDTLYVTSIRPAGIDLSDQPLAGGVFALNPGTRGLPETPFSL